MVSFPVPPRPIELGSVSITYGVLSAFGANSTQDECRLAPIYEILRRFIHRDWGDMSPTELADNDRSIAEGDSVLAAYDIRPVDSQATVRVWINRYPPGDEPLARTTVLLPSEW